MEGVGTELEGQIGTFEGTKKREMEKVQDEWMSSKPSCALRLVGLFIVPTVLKGKHVYPDENPESPEGPRVGQRQRGCTAAE